MHGSPVGNGHVEDTIFKVPWDELDKLMTKSAHSGYCSLLSWLAATVNNEKLSLAASL